MQKFSFLVFVIVILLFQNATAQVPKKPNAVEIYQQIQKLNFLGSVLYIAAHPDDENTRLISYLANYKNARTGYLSLTRGDGGQNLIGPEMRELLGVIRTQELIEARKIDGGEQFFTRANDFGFSKNPDETLQIWDKDEVVSDVVWAIRKFQPDIIINRFDHRSPGTTHGHHTASAMLSINSFDLSNDRKMYAKQLAFVEPWQPKRLFFNTSWWFYGSQEKFDKADKTNMINLQTGVYYQSVGKSNQEIAALSRSRHQSQGFGSTGSRGEESEYLELLKGEMPKDKSNIFEGIDTSWNRVKGGKTIGSVLANVEKNFDFKNPAASIPDLVTAYTMVQKLEDTHWKSIKSEEIKNSIAACAGLFMEATAEKQSATPKGELKIKAEAINRSTIAIHLLSIDILPEQKKFDQNINLNHNSTKNFEFTIQLPESIDFSAPYWLKEAGTEGMYRVDDQKKIGIPDIIRHLKLIFNIEINNVIIPFERIIVYKYNDEVKGETYKTFDVIPDVTISITDKVKIFNSNKTKTVGVRIKAGNDDIRGDLTLELNQKWKVTPTSIAFTLLKKDTEQTHYFEVTPPENEEETNVKAIVTINKKRFNTEKTEINYEHISYQQVLKPAQAKFIKLDIKTGNERIGYIMGAGDEVPGYLSQMGYEVTILKPEQITSENISPYNVIMLGIRAYNTIEALSAKQGLLFDAVKNGTTMIVQYNTAGKFVVDAIAPFPLKISRERVTEENAEVTFLDPDNPILKYPNTITRKDFQEWVQEQGLYYPGEWDKAFTPVISSHDKGESPKNSAILVAKYGKGYYIYTGLSFFRELPAGISGAYRLLANMIAVGKK